MMISSVERRLSSSIQSPLRFLYFQQRWSETLSCSSGTKRFSPSADTAVDKPLNQMNTLGSVPAVNYSDPPEISKTLVDSLPPIDIDQLVLIDSQKYHQVKKSTRTSVCGRGLGNKAL